MKAAVAVTFLLFPYVLMVSQDLVLCINNIVLQHFPIGRPIVFSVSSAEANFDNLLRELHDILEWPFQIYSSDLEIMDDEFDDLQKHESYIIFISAVRDGDVSEILDEQIGGIEGSDSWNPHAKFLMVICGSFSQDREELAQEVAEQLWASYKIVEAVILIPEKVEKQDDSTGSRMGIYEYVYQDCYKKNKYIEDSHNGGTNCVNDGHVSEITFELYTWIPYQSIEICDEVNIFLIDRWLVAERRFEKDENLYPRKIPNYFHGCPIVVSPMEAPPIYVMAVNYTDDNGNTLYDYKGYEPAHMKAILILMNFTIVYRHIPMVDYYDTRVQSLFDLSSGLMDIVIGCIPLHPIVSSMNDPTHVIYGDDIYWLVPCGKPNPRMQQVGKIFSVSLWCAMILVIIVSAFLMWKITKHTVGESPGYKSISICLINLWALTLGVGVSEIPRSPRQRVIFLFLVWYSFAICLLFQTYYTSILVDPGIGEQIHTRQELYSSNLIYEYKEGLETYIANAYPEYYSEITLPRKECNYKDTCVVEYYQRDDMTTISSTLFTECFLLLVLPSDSDAPHFCTIEEVITTILFPMYLSKGSPLVKPINRMIRLMQESGLRDKIDRETIDAFRYEKLEIDFEFDDRLLANGEVIDYFVFSMSHMQMAFYMLGLGCGFGGVVLALEIIHFKMHNEHSSKKF